MLETGIVTGAKGTFSAFKGPGVRGAEVSAVMQKGQVTGKRGGTRTTLKGILKSKSSIQDKLGGLGLGIGIFQSS